MVSYRRILLKLSGEALSSSSQSIDSEMLNKVVSIIQSALDLGVEIAIVIGGGNLYRGASLSKEGMNKITGDHIGMLATVMNALALSDALERNKIPSKLITANHFRRDRTHLMSCVRLRFVTYTYISRMSIQLRGLCS